jgi:hypothetical protein
MDKIKFGACSILLVAILFSCSVSKDAKIRTLKGYNTTKISLQYDTLLLLSGSSHKIGFTAYTDEGKILRTTGFLKGTLRWSDFKVETGNARYSSGKVSIPKTKVDENLLFIPFKIRLKYQPEKIFYDTLWMNFEKEISIYPINTFKKSPGAKVLFGMDVTYNNNKEVSYHSLSNVKKAMTAYEVLVKGGAYRDGAFTISNNIFENTDHKPGFMVRLLKNPDVFTTMDILLDYKDQYSIYGDGNSGMGGFSGSNGSSGLTGEHGQSGEDGKNGYDGNYGHDIDVFADMYFDSILNTNLMKVFVDDLTTKKQHHFLINPNGGNLMVNANGGYGGLGGFGGWGGDGGNGFKGEMYTDYVNDEVATKDTAGQEHKEIVPRAIQRQKKGGEGGFGGSGGYGGAGGNGGDGGHVILYYTPAVKSQLYLIQCIVHGGDGGRGGSGAHGGDGGKGGEGNPKGRNGLHGKNGVEGVSGYSGRQGIVDMQEVDKIPW